MPLPLNCSLSLLGHSRPGDTVHSKPKQAIIIRLSTEILDALEANPDAVKIDFNDNPMLWAGPAHFAMNSAKENLHHDLYLRAASATKKNVPLKLHAHVIGKFQVERQLDNDLRSRLRQSTKTLQEQRQERGIIHLETLPVQPASKSSKKVAVAKPSRPVIDSAKRDGTSYRNRKENLKSVRRKMLQLLAVNDRTADEIVRLLGGSECTPSDRSELIDLLEELADPTVNATDAGSKLSKIYRLKLKPWLEIRPIEWEWSNDQERSAVSTKFESALRRLEIPESNSIWQFALHRSGRDFSTVSSVTTVKVKGRAASGVLKTEGTPLLTKDRRLKSVRTDSGDDQIGKNGGRSGAKGIVGKAKALDAMSLPPSLKASTPLRKPPGSGFRSGKAPLQTTGSEAMEASGVPHQDKEAGVKAGDVESSLRRQAQARHHQKKIDSGRTRDSTVQNAQELADKSDNFQVPNEGAIQKRRVSSRDPDVGLDRVAGAGPVLKKRKVEHSATETDSPSTSMKQSKPRDQGTLKRPLKLVSSSRHKSKDDTISAAPIAATKLRVPSPLPVENTSSNRTVNSKAGNSAKRRRSPVYTSSEDDAESMPQSQEFITTDHASLRKRYYNAYSEYLTVFHKLVTLRDKIGCILKSHDGSSISDSDADLEMVDPDEFRRLCSHHKKLREELESILLVLSQTGGRDL